MPFTLDSARRVPRVSAGGAPTALAASPRRRRFSQGLVFVLFLAVLLVPGTDAALAPTTSPASAETSLEDLKEQADAAADALEEATNEYVEREEALQAAQEELVSTLHELQQTELELAEMREPLAQLASTLYQQPDGGLLAMLASGTFSEDLQAESYVAKISEDNEALIQDATDLREQQFELAAEAQELQSATQLEQVELSAELESLRKRSEESTNRLTEELESRGLDVDAYMAGVECDPSRASAAQGYPNGLIPQESLCSLYDGYFLRADAAVDFLLLNQEYQERFGENMCINSAYRDLQNQHRVYAQQPPGFAAVPGTSNHGLGLAIDLGCGIQHFRSERWNWMEANGARYGWYHPAWAKSNPFEPWHWEYDVNHR